MGVRCVVGFFGEQNVQSLCLYGPFVTAVPLSLLALKGPCLSATDAFSQGLRSRFCGLRVAQTLSICSRNKKSLTSFEIRLGKTRQRATLPPANLAVPSPMRLFTSVFGMGTGVTSSLWPPEKQSNVSG